MAPLGPAQAEREKQAGVILGLAEAEVACRFVELSEAPGGLRLGNSEQNGNRKIGEQIAHRNALAPRPFAVGQHIPPGPVRREDQVGGAPIGDGAAAVQSMDEARHRDDDH